MKSKHGAEQGSAKGLRETGSSELGSNPCIKLSLKSTVSQEIGVIKVNRFHLQSFAKRVLTNVHLEVTT